MNSFDWPHLDKSVSPSAFPFIPPPFPLPESTLCTPPSFSDLYLRAAESVIRQWCVEELGGKEAVYSQ